MTSHGTYARYIHGCRCDACRKANTDRHRTYRHNNPAVREADRKRNAKKRREQPELMRNAHLLRRYGITLEERDRRFAEQGNRCMLCGTADLGKRGPQVDHDHTTDVLRDILCTNCNVGLGSFDDNPELLRAAASYVERHRGISPESTIDEHW